MTPWVFSSTSALEATAASAGRALLAACAVGAGLRLLRVRNVAAQKTAWTLVLAGALLIPLLSPWMARQSWTQNWMPHWIAVAQSGIERAQAAGARMESAMRPMPARKTGSVTAPAFTEISAARIQQLPAPAHSARQIAPDEPAGVYGPQFPARATQPSAIPLRASLLNAAWALYLVIATALLLRLFYGLGAATRLWRNSVPAELAATEFPVRIHNEIPSPVTIGSGILLPADYAEWDAEKLRVALAHEGSHVRQRDFYLQLAAGTYAAIFWFSPLGWWLKCKLSDLGEAIGDRAAVTQAASRASYARLLLEFAEQSRDGWTRTTQFGVAMARTGRISHRIERLLNEQRFTQAFTGSRARLIGAAVLAPVAIFVSAALVHVEAQAVTSVRQSASTQTQAPATGVSHPDSAAITVPSNATQAPAQAPATPAAPPATVAAPNPPASPVTPDTTGSAEASQSNGTTITVTNTNTSTDGQESHTTTIDGHSFVYASSKNGDSYAVVRGNGNSYVTFSGNGSGNMRSQLDAARRMAHGDFLWFTHDGKSYVVDDPAAVAQLESLSASIDALGAEQSEYGRQQEAFGKQQEELARQLAQMRVNQPDFQKQMAELSAQIAQMKIDVKIPKIDPQQLDDLKKQVAALQLDQPDFERKMAELNAQIARLTVPKFSELDQQRLNELNEKLAETSRKIAESAAKAAEQSGRYGEIQGRLGEIQGRLGERQGKLGEIQGKLGAEQGRLSEELNRRVQEIIQQSLQNGTARPVK